MASGEQQIMTVEDLTRLATQYKNDAQKCQDVATFLTNQNNNLFWQSEAANSFKENMGKYINLLQQLNSQFVALSNELSTRADILQTSQGALS